MYDRDGDCEREGIGEVHVCGCMFSDTLKKKAPSDGDLGNTGDPRTYSNYLHTA